MPADILLEYFLSIENREVLEFQWFCSFLYWEIGNFVKINNKLLAILALTYRYTRTNKIHLLFKNLIHALILVLKTAVRFRKPPLFQHNGMKSSLKGKEQSLQESDFELPYDMKLSNADNPPASMNAKLLLIAFKTYNYTFLLIWLYASHFTLISACRDNILHDSCIFICSIRCIHPSPWVRYYQKQPVY